MKCTEFEKLVNEYVDGELSHSFVEIEEHINTCTTCKQLYEETLELKTLLNELDEVELPDDFEATLHEKLVEASKEAKVIPFYKRSHNLRILTSVAAVAIISIFAFKAGTLVPMGNNNAANDSNMAVMATEEMYSADKAMDNSDSNMAMNNMAEDEESYGEPEVALTFSEAPMNKSIRMEMDHEMYAEESVNYWLETYTDTQQLQGFIDLYKLIDFNVEDNRYTFYITNEDYLIFSENLQDVFDITNEFVLEFKTGHEEVLNQFNEQVKRVDALNAQLDTDEEEDASTLEIEKRVLETLNDEVTNIENYKGLKQITITINKE